MSLLYERLVRPVAFRFDAEQTHRAALKAGEFAGRGLGNGTPHWDQGLLVKAGSVTYPAVAGLAAGYDKYLQLVDIMPRLGAGHEEGGTFTPYPRDGNVKPRLFRLPRDHALINRMGLNNDGIVMAARKVCRAFAVPLDISFDPNVLFIEDIEPDEETRTGMLTAREQLWRVPYAKKINVSCPNTTDGKAYENRDALDRVLAETDRINSDIPRDVYVKFSHDLTDNELGELIDVCTHHDVTGFVIGNTSNSRSGLQTPNSALARIGSGGLSGLPLMERKLAMIRYARKKTDGRKIIVGVGGIGCNPYTDPAFDTYQYLLAGAHLVQILTGIPYRGFGIFRQIHRNLPRYLAEYGSIDEFLRRRE